MTMNGYSRLSCNLNDLPNNEYPVLNVLKHAAAKVKWFLYMARVFILILLLFYHALVSMCKK